MAQKLEGFHKGEDAETLSLNAKKQSLNSILKHHHVFIFMFLVDIIC